MLWDKWQKLFRLIVENCTRILYSLYRYLCSSTEYFVCEKINNVKSPVVKLPAKTTYKHTALRAYVGKYKVDTSVDVNAITVISPCRSINIVGEIIVGQMASINIAGEMIVGDFV